MAKSTKGVKKRKQAQSKKLVINKELEEALIHFLENHSARRLSINVRRMLLMHLSNAEAVASTYLNEMLWDLEGLFDLLDAMEEQWKPKIS